MKKATSLMLSGVILFLCFSKIQAQIYLESIGGIKELDLCTCDVTEIAPTISSSAIGVSQNQNLVHLASDQVFSYNLITGNSTLLGNISGGANNLVVAQNGLIYSVGINASGIGSFLGVLNPTLLDIFEKRREKPDFCVFSRHKNLCFPRTYANLAPCTILTA